MQPQDPKRTTYEGPGIFIRRGNMDPQGRRHEIDAFEMWTLRRMLRIPWMTWRTNALIVTELKEQQRMSSLREKEFLATLDI